MRRKTSAAEQIAALQGLQAGLTKVLVTVAVVALAFTATNVTLFAIDHHISVYIAWLLDPMVAVALGAVLIVDGRLSEHGVQPSGWATGLRWFAGLGTWLMNCWGSLWPAGTPFGMPREIDPAGLVLHSIPPVLLIVLAEAITFYRRAILDRIAVLRDQVDTVVERVEAPTVHPASTPTLTPAPAGQPGTVARPAPVADRLAICGAQRVYPLAVPPASTPDDEEQQNRSRLSTEEAAEVIRQCFEGGDTISEAAVKSTRSTSYVHKVYGRLANPPQDGPGLALVGG
ncbi:MULTISPECIES: extensin [unclassified Streptomyces]|uniref:extensin n=1 Tax=unclassified Streptomyces TaxID=2593676 RepID=UPI002E379530|nr:extensin [Streptomyces sp. NBC_01693]